MGKKYWQKCGQDGTDRQIVLPVLVWEKITDHKELLTPVVRAHANDILDMLTDTTSAGNKCSPHFVHFDLTPYRSGYRNNPSSSEIYSYKYSGTNYTRQLLYDPTNGLVAGTTFGQCHWLGWVWYEDVTTNDSEYKFEMLPNGGSFSLGPTAWIDGQIRFVYPWVCMTNLTELFNTKVGYEDYEGKSGSSIHMMGVRGSSSNPNSTGSTYQVEYVGGDNTLNPRSTKFKKSASQYIADAYDCFLVGFDIKYLNLMATGDPSRSLIQSWFHLEGGQTVPKCNKYVMGVQSKVYFTARESGLEYRLGFSGFTVLTP